MTKRIFKPTAIMALLLAAVLGFTMATSTTAHAATTFWTTAQNVSTSWTTVAESTTGFSCKVGVSILNNRAYRTDVRLLDRSGNVVWSQTGALAVNDTQRYNCGSNVYKVQLKTQGGTASVRTWNAGALDAGFN